MKYCHICRGELAVTNTLIHNECVVRRRYCENCEVGVNTVELYDEEFPETGNSRSHPAKSKKIWQERKIKLMKERAKYGRDTTTEDKPRAKGNGVQRPVGNGPRKPGADCCTRDALVEHLRYGYFPRLL